MDALSKSDTDPDIKPSKYEAKYIREQEKQDMPEDKWTAKEYDNPFKGSRQSVYYGLNEGKASVF